MATLEQLQSAQNLALREGDQMAVAEIGHMIELYAQDRTTDSIARNSEEGQIANQAISETESFVRGFAQDISLGFQDELAGFMDVALTGDLDQYEIGRDEARANNRQAKSQNPSAYGSGEIAGTVADIGLAMATGGLSAIPKLMGKAGVKAVGKKGIRAGMKQGFKAGALSGGAYGLGTSESESIEGDIANMATGALAGATVGTVLGGATSTFGKGRDYLARNKREIGIKSAGSPRLLAKKFAQESITEATEANPNVHATTDRILGVMDNNGGPTKLEGMHTAVREARENANAELIKTRKEVVPKVAIYDEVVADELIDKIAHEGATNAKEIKAKTTMLNDFMMDYGTTRADGTRVLNSQDTRNMAFAIDQNLNSFDIKNATGTERQALQYGKAITKQLRGVENGILMKGMDKGMVTAEEIGVLNIAKKKFAQADEAQRYLTNAEEGAKYADLMDKTNASSIGEGNSPVAGLLMRTINWGRSNVLYPASKLAEKTTKPLPELGRLTENLGSKALKGVETGANFMDVATTQGIMRGLSDGNSQD